ncbi:16304_t:CDS:10, partial [Acaulospora morrowiae]
PVSNRPKSPRDFVTRVLSPKVAVISSPDADQVCQANNFPDFFTLIKPFGERIEGKVTARDSQGLPNPIDNFVVRFSSLTSLEQPDVQLTSQILADKVKSISSNSLSVDLPQIAAKADVTERYLEVSQDDLTPWYAEYRRLFFTFTGVSEHETFEHPVACIIAISSSNKEPIATLSQMYNITTPAPIFDKGFMDTNILKYYVLLHDNHKVSLEHSEEVYDRMKRSFGLHCHLLKLNSIPPILIPEDRDSFSISTPPVDNSESTSDIWTSYVNESNILNALLSTSSSAPNTTSMEIYSRQNSLSNYSLPLSPTTSTLNSPTSSFTEDMLLSKEGGNDSQVSLGLGSISSMVIYGKYLSEDDIAGIHTFVRELVVQSIVPFMERNIQYWNEQVASSRRGIAGRIFSASRRYFGAGKAAGPVQQSSYASINNSSNTIYPHNSPEAQMRKLADWSFMLRDYKFAHSMYETVKRDFSADKAWKYYAGTQEMIGICLQIAATNISNRTDFDHYFEHAVNAYYNRSKSPFYATRATILYYELLKFRNSYKEAPPALVRLTGEDSDLRSGLFLEQAAHAFLRCPRPMVRKYAFHLVMAGHRYGKCNQRKHAYRCYLAALKVFDNRSWSLVEDHIHFALGRQSFHMGDLSMALKFFVKLLRESRQPSANQSAYMREFLYMYKQYLSKTGKEPEFDSEELQIPIIEDSSVKVVLSNLQSIEYDDVWETMENEFLEEGFSGLDNYGNPRKKPSTISSDIHRTMCAVGEPFFVQLMLYNPMQIPINVNNLMLKCEFIPLSSTEETSSESNGDLTDDDKTRISESADSDDISRSSNFEEYELETLPDVSLEASEKKMISLRVLPKKQGKIKILGLKYILNSLIRGLKKFAKRGKRLNQTKEQRLSVVYAYDHSLDLVVTSSMPLLEVAFHSFPEMLLSGEVAQVFLEINNKGQEELRDLRVKMSHPSFFCIGDANMLEQKVYNDDSERGFSTERLLTRNKIFNTSIKDIPLPPQENADQNPSLFLPPGKTTLIPIWIRGDRIGKHVFRFLFTYGLEKNNSAMRYRSLRYTKMIQVLPSLKINAFTRPSTRGLNEFILGIEIENLQTTAEFQLAQLSSISPSWTISSTIFTYYRIKKSETFLLIEPIDAGSKDTPEIFTSNALEGLLIGKSETQKEPSPIDLLVTNIPFTDSIIKHSSNPLEGFSLNSRVQWRNNTLNANFPVIPSKKYPSIFTLYNTNDVDLALYWNIPTLLRQGHHYIIGINLGVQQNPFQSPNILASSNRALFEQTVRERAALVNSLLKNKNFKDESPLKLIIQCADTLEHDFQSQRFCIIPIKILIKNCLWNKRIGFTLEMLPPDSETRSTFHKSVHPTVFQWIGSTFKYATLSAGEVQTFVTKACFVRSGVYDVNRWKLTVNFDPSATENESTSGSISTQHEHHESGTGVKG